MFCDVIGAKARLVVLFNKLQPCLEQVRKRNAVVIQMIENAELQSQHFLPELKVQVAFFLNGWGCRARGRASLN